MKVYGGLARFFACRDGVEDWHGVTQYEVSTDEDIKMATWLRQDYDRSE